MLNEFSIALSDYLIELEQNLHILLTENEQLRFLNNELNNQNEQLVQLNNSLQTQIKQLHELLHNDK